MSKNLKCPKCGGEVIDFGKYDDWGYFQDEPYQCYGFYTGKYPEFSRDCYLNRTESCGWFTREQVEARDY